MLQLRYIKIYAHRLYRKELVLAKFKTRKIIVVVFCMYSYKFAKAHSFKKLLGSLVHNISHLYLVHSANLLLENIKCDKYKTRLSICTWRNEVMMHILQMRCYRDPKTNYCTCARF